MNQQKRTHPKLPGVEIIPTEGNDLRKGQPQQVLVKLEPRARIPLHTHEVDAHMLAFEGSAELLSGDERNGSMVLPGNVILFKAYEAHGFQAGPEGFSFISDNGGIVDDDPSQWDISFTH